MLILHLVGRSHRRGAELVAIELAAELDALGHRNRLVAVGSGHEGGSLDLLPPLVSNRSQNPAALVKAAICLRRLLDGEQPDVILAHGGSAAQVAVLAGLRDGPTLVWQRILGLPEDPGPLRRAWWRFVLGRVDAVVALTVRLEDEVRALGYEGTIRVIPNARRSERFEGLDRPRLRAELCARLSIPPERHLVGLVGHLVDQKDPVTAVRAFGELVAGGADAHLVVAGSGPLAEQVRREVDLLGSSSRVSLVGHVDEVEEVLGGLDLLWLTSRDEGVPGVLVEAAMAGCPVVTFPVGDVAEVVEHESTGLILLSADPSELVERTSELFGSVDRLVAMSAAARDRGRHLAMDVVVHRYLGLFEALG